MHIEHLVEGLKGDYIYIYYICIEATPLGQSFPCAVTGYLTHLRRREKEEGQRQGREGKKGANMLAAAAAHLLVEGDMVTCGYLWMIGGCMMTV